MSDIPKRHPTRSEGVDTDAVLHEAARLVALEQNVPASTALRLIRHRAFDSGRFVGEVAHDITGGLRITDD